MICPVKFTHELSALKKRRGILEVAYLTAVPGRGNGADDETTRRAIEGNGEEDHLVGSSRDHRGDRSDHEALAGTAGDPGLFRVGGPAQRQAQRPPCAVGKSGGDARSVPGHLLRSEHAAFPRKASRRTRHRVELHLRAKGAARSRAGGARTKAPQAPPPKRTAANARHVATHRWQQTPVVRRRSLVRPDRDSGRRHQRNLLRATGRGRIHPDGDGRLANGDRKQGIILRALQRSGQSFLCDPEGRREGGQTSSDPSGPGSEGTGGADDSGLFAAGSRPQRAEFRDLARAAAAGVAAGRNRNPAGRQRVSAPAVYSRLQPEVHGSGGRERNRIPAHHTLRPGLDLHGSNRARGGQGQYRCDYGAQLAVGEEPVSQFPRRLYGDDPSTSGWERVDPLWTTRRRPLHSLRRDSPSQREKAPGEPWKRRARGNRGKPKAGFPPFPPSLGNPATPAGFPLSHRSDCGSPLTD